ncbi:uncharacterized protein LOC111047051 isoform X4 [Nilaparvata lugens]|uniref:uncharacterized protein LOC111047051 isoform X4 n=1 Tax=Nilaparvata lugens TaxID=108931 RepID=UPI00193E33B1|nr:uncharacterized protein LOC111047051 isoform X4 [Nilaparvata lugens]
MSRKLLEAKIIRSKMESSKSQQRSPQSSPASNKEALKTECNSDDDGTQSHINVESDDRTSTNTDLRNGLNNDNKEHSDGGNSLSDDQLEEVREKLSRVKQVNGNSTRKDSDASKKSKAFREIDLERILYRWFERRQGGSVCSNRRLSGGSLVELDEILKKALNLAKRMGASKMFLKGLDKEWIRTWQKRYGLFRENDEGTSDDDNSTGEAEPSIGDYDDSEEESELEKVMQVGSYTDDQVYCAFGFQFDWTSLPDRTLDVQSPEDGVWLLMAGNRSGRHRTRILITGKQWRPACLQNVNMLSQPVVYAGGGVGRLTSDLFTWWFHKEFVPAALALNPNGALLVAEKTDFAPSTSDCVSADGKVRLVLYSKRDVLRTSIPEQKLIEAELRSRYAMLLLHNALIEQQSRPVTQWLSTFTLKDAFPILHKAWLNIRPDSFSRCWRPADASPLTAHSRPPLSFDAPASTPLQLEHDRMLLLELQWLCHDLGLEVTDEDLASWVAGQLTRTEVVYVKPEPVEAAADEERSPPGAVTASEAVSCLVKALSWMETEPIEPNLLLVVRDVMALAKQASKMGLGAGHPGAGLPFFCHNGEHLGQPPPAHMGIPPYQLDPKGAGEYWRAPPPITPHEWKRLGPILAASGLTRAPMYPFTTGQYPYPMLSPEMSQVAASWHTPSMYPISSASAGFRSPYPSSLPISSSSLTSDLYRFSPSGLMAPHPGLSPHSHPSLASHPAIVTPGPKQDLSQASELNHRSSSMDRKNSSSTTNDGSKSQDSGHTSNNQEKKPHIKKPLNAFMLYMKEMRAKVVAECTLKESAAINQILGRRWHSLTREEQAKYYEKARQERQLHMELYPGWSARDNYGYGAKKKKRKKERVPIADTGGNNMKKCRARYGLDQQSQWCKPCSPDLGAGGLGLGHSIVHHGPTTAASPQEPTYVNL